MASRFGTMEFSLEELRELRRALDSHAAELADSSPRKKLVTDLHERVCMAVRNVEYVPPPPPKSKATSDED